jgi:hypothetical protein
MKCLTLEEAAKVGKEDDFFQNVKKEIIPNLIKRGILNGKTVKGKPCVIDDDTFQRVMRHGIESMVVGLLLAAELSAALHTTAVTAWDDDFSGSTLVICENGEKVKVLADGDDWGDFYQFFYEQGIFVPESFIATTKTSAELLVAKPSEVERADHLLIAIPSESQSNGPHVFYKLGMMAQALSGELEDEEAFQSNLVEGLWSQVQAMLKPGKP